MCRQYSSNSFESRTNNLRKFSSRSFESRTFTTVAHVLSCDFGDFLSAQTRGLYHHLKNQSSFYFFRQFDSDGPSDHDTVKYQEGGLLEGNMPWFTHVDMGLSVRGILLSWSAVTVARPVEDFFLFWGRIYMLRAFVWGSVKEGQNVFYISTYIPNK